ncbi:hypothetical protein MRX96_058556 [Rhipicephalus microplus]
MTTPATAPGVSPEAGAETRRQGTLTSLGSCAFYPVLLVWRLLKMVGTSAFAVYVFCGGRRGLPRNTPSSVSWQLRLDSGIQCGAGSICVHPTNSSPEAGV